MPKPEREFFDVTEIDWTPVPGGVEGLTERILAPDNQGGVASRMLRFAPGTNTARMGVLKHDFWEEVFILEGSLHDLILDKTFSAGDYACRPPGMQHGPWESPGGCITIEVRYHAAKETG